MTLLADELVVAASGHVYFAPVGTSLPDLGDDPTDSLDAAFIEAGYVTEDGATLSVGSEVTDYNAWQSLQPVRREKTAQDISVTFSLEQYNQDNIPFAFGGGSVDSSGGVFFYEFPQAGDSLDERSLVVDAEDGDNNYRFVFPRGNVTEAVESQFQRNALAVLPITFKALEPLGGGSPGFFNTDAAAFATGS